MYPETLLDEIETEVEIRSLGETVIFKIKNQTTTRIRLTGHSMVYDQNEDSYALIRTELTGTESGFRIAKYDECGIRTELIEGSDDYRMAIEHAMEKTKFLLSRIEDQNLENFKTLIQEVISKMK